MKNKYLWGALTVLLVALAFFLPAELSQWNDRKLVDSVQITQETEEEAGFAESIRLTVPEKLMLLRSKNLTAVEIPENGHKLQLTVGNDGEVYFSEEPTAIRDAADQREAEEQVRRWSQRMTDAQGELRALQKAGAMPLLWPQDSAVELGSGREILYIDNETQVTFLVYYMELRCAPYTLHLSVDAQTGKFLSVTIRWNRDGKPAWGTKGIQNFGSSWRDYWDMDGVDASYMDSAYIGGLLMETEALRQRNGDYAASAEISFDYGDQEVDVPLYCRAVGDWGCSIQWNS